MLRSSRLAAAVLAALAVSAAVSAQTPATGEARTLNTVTVTGSNIRRAEAEGSRLTLQPGFDAAAVRVTGHVVGQPPFTGTLGHRGWRATETRLPKLGQGHDASVLAQAEVEL